MIKTIRLKDTNNEKILTKSAINCSVINRSDLVAVVGLDDKYYITSNYFYNDEVSFVRGKYIEINKDLYYLVSRSYSDNAKKKLFSSSDSFYRDEICRIKELLEPVEKQLSV